MESFRIEKKTAAEEPGVDVQFSHMDFDVMDGDLARNFCAAISQTGASPHYILGPPFCVHCSSARKNLLKNVIVLEEVKATLSAAIIGPGYVRQADSDWRGENCTQYHSYATPENRELLVEVAFARKKKLRRASNSTRYLQRGAWISKVETGSECS